MKDLKSINLLGKFLVIMGLATLSAFLVGILLMTFIAVIFNVSFNDVQTHGGFIAAVVVVWIVSAVCTLESL